MNRLPIRPEPLPPRVVRPPPSGVQRLRWRQVTRRVDQAPGRPIRLWLPLTPLLVLFSPLILLVLAVAVFLPRPIGVNPIHIILGVGRVLSSLSGTRIEVENDHRPVTINIF